MTSQVAEGLDLLPKKGLIKRKAQMEMFFFFDKTYSWMLLWLMASFFMKEGKILRKGTYEK